MQRQFGNTHEVFSLRRIDLVSRGNWREDKQEILQQSTCRYMTDWISGDKAIELQYKLEMFLHTDIALSSSLDAIIPVPGFQSATSLACLLNAYHDGYIRGNQDNIDKAITTQINAWTFNNQSILKERAWQTTENPLKQSEQGTQYQIWKDNWMIDECSRAMYDTSSESPGK